MTLILIAAAFAAGLVNSIAGGGQLLAFPAMVLSGVPSVVANASSSVALFPGSFAASLAYRKNFRHLEGIPLKGALIASVSGGTVGALLLLSTPQSLFDVIVPWLLLFATALFIFGKPVTSLMKNQI